MSPAARPTPRAATSKSRSRFSRSDATAVQGTKYFYLRAGATHKFLAVWVVVVEGRVLVRSWNDKDTGWYRAFLAHGAGTIRIGTREVPVRGRRVVSARLLDAMDAAYAAKYTTPANRRYVRGFRAQRRRNTTLELLPA